MPEQNTNPQQPTETLPSVPVGTNPVVSGVVPENAPKTVPPSAAGIKIVQQQQAIAQQQQKQKAPLPSKTELVKRLEALKEDALKNVGKPEHNAYLWIKRNVTPLLVELDTLAAVTEDLVNKVAALRVNTAVEKPKLEDRSYKG